MLFGMRMKEERTKRKMTQKDFGLLLGVTATMVMYYERGIKKPTVDQLINIADVLNTNPNYLLGFEYVAKTPEEDYTIRISRYEMRILKELRMQKQVYKLLMEEPRKGLELISRKLNK